MKLKIGDTVKVTLGKDRGKTGKIERVLPRTQAVVVAGTNMYKKHVKRSGDKAGQIVELPRPLAVAKVALICPHCHQPTRVGYQIEKTKKLRICRKCKAKL
ncbi:MAG: 50S ribosomal protein L24 [Patescibacteria group bacterium]|nr:50S ribosomal protein L24 [Candidatus Beckwithbacteria bacterium]MDZ4228686.1 50S ribosomal protein L24 [Patescibacteria group bacterium]